MNWRLHVVYQFWTSREALLARFRIVDPPPSSTLITGDTRVSLIFPLRTLKTLFFFRKIRETPCFKKTLLTHDHVNYNSLPLIQEYCYIFEKNLTTKCRSYDWKQCSILIMKRHVGQQIFLNRYENYRMLIDNLTLLVDRVSLAQLRMKRRNRHTVISVLGNHNLSTGFMRDCHVWLAIVTYDYSRRRIHTGEQQCRIPSVRCVWPVSVGERRARLPGVFSCPPPSTILM